jgi:hypothetical protein
MRYARTGAWCVPAGASTTVDRGIDTAAPPDWMFWSAVDREEVTATHRRFRGHKGVVAGQGAADPIDRGEMLWFGVAAWVHVVDQQDAAGGEGGDGEV